MQTVQRGPCMPVFVMVNGESGRVTVRTTDCVMRPGDKKMPAKLRLDAAKLIAEWYEANKDG